MKVLVSYTEREYSAVTRALRELEVKRDHDKGSLADMDGHAKRAITTALEKTIAAEDKARQRAAARAAQPKRQPPPGFGRKKDAQA